MLNTYGPIATAIPEGIRARLDDGTLCDELGYWTAVDRTLHAIAALPAQTTADVAAILNANPEGVALRSQGIAFFPGSGGENSLRDALRTAGWQVVWSAAAYHYIVRHPITGDAIEYVEGDVLDHGPVKDLS